MKKSGSLFLIIFFGFFLTSCTSKATAILPATNQTRNFPTPQDDCRKWRQIYDALDEEAKMSFQREEIYYVSNGYILSENLVKDCRLRVEIGKFIRSAIMENSDEDREFARENSKEIVGVLQRVWNSPNFSSDGMHHEKYTLLMSDRGITDEALALLMGQLLKEEGIYSPELGSEGEIFYTLLYRRLPSLVPMILDSLKHEEKEKDFTGQVYALFLLQRDTSDKKYLAKMKAIAKNPEVSDAARKVLEKIISKIEKKEKIDSEYFGDFSYALINNKSLMK